MGTISMSNMDRPAPKVYRRLVNATVMFFLPMITGIIQGVPMKHDIRNIWMIGIVAVPFLLKGIGMILGNGEVYADISQIKPSEIEPVVAVKSIDNKTDLSSIKTAAPNDDQLQNK